jgi:pyrimidine deaminase RibD-like protein
VTDGVSPDRDRTLLRAAIDLSRRCPPSYSAFSVGALLVSSDGERMAEGFSRDVDPQVHAEESLLTRVAPGDARLSGATLYTSLEPCSVRKSRERSCSQLILESGIGRLVFAMREPGLFVDGHGADVLRAAGLVVVELADFAAAVRGVNAHLFVTS